MDLTVTACGLIVLLAAAAFCGWRGARPPNIIKGPRLIPWRPLMMICVVGIILLLVHLLNLLGVQTGERARY